MCRDYIKLTHAHFPKPPAHCAWSTGSWPLGAPSQFSGWPNHCHPIDGAQAPETGNNCLGRWGLDGLDFRRLHCSFAKRFCQVAPKDSEESCWTLGRSISKASTVKLHYLLSSYSIALDKKCHIHTISMYLPYQIQSNLTKSIYINILPKSA
jgi:hypothetical protein